MNRPEIVSIGVVWDSERPSLEHIMAVFATVGTNLRLRDVFQSVVDDRWAQMTHHQLVGVVTYYGKHYSTFFFHTKLRVWIYFDDATVREIGPHWEQVVEKCRRGHFQPLLLLYANPHGSPVPVETAPNSITQVTGQMNTSNSAKQASVVEAELEKMKDDLGQSHLSRAHTPSHEIGESSIPIIGRDYQNLHNSIQDSESNNDDVFESTSSSSKYKRQFEAMKQSGGILPNKPNIVGRGRTDSDEGVVRNGDKQRTINCASYNIRGNRNSSSSLDHFDKDPLKIPDSANIPRRRDSGNWSGDRNSASSSSSTSLENPYPYLVNKSRHPSSPSSKQPPMSNSQRHQHPEYANLGIGVNHMSLPQQNGPVQQQQSPQCGANGQYDPGYDSYSLSSNDSYPIQQNLKHNLQVCYVTLKSCFKFFSI